MALTIFSPVLRPVSPFAGLRGRTVLALVLLAVVLIAAASAPLRAATLRGSIYDATGIDDLLVGGVSYDLTFHDAQSGSWYDTFSTRHVPSTLTAVTTESLARAVLGALQDFIRPMGPIQVNNGQDLLVLPYASDGTDITYLTTMTGSYNWGGVYGSFEMDAENGDFYRTVSFVTVQPSFGASSPGFAPLPVPVPPAGLALLGALGFGAWLSRRRS